MLRRNSMPPTITVIISIFCSLAASKVSVAKQSESSSKDTMQTVSFKSSDGGLVFATLSGSGDHAVVLAHGARFDKESWAKQTVQLEAAGFQVLAIDFRGYGKSKAGTEKNARHLDVLAAVKYLHKQGAKRVSIVGGSMGGGAAARASVESSKGEIDRLILLAHMPIEHPEKLKGKILFVVSKGDRLNTRVRKQYESAPEPKRLVVLEGSAHAQNIFQTKQSDQLMKLVVDWLN